DHLHICDTAQHLLLTLGLDDDDAADAGDEPPSADVGLQLLDDPFDVDAFLPPMEAAEAGGQGAELSVASTCAPSAVPPVGPAKASRVDEAALRRGLTHRQLATLPTRSQSGWPLRLGPSPMFLPPFPVGFDRSRQRHVVIEP